MWVTWICWVGTQTPPWCLQVSSPSAFPCGCLFLSAVCLLKKPAVSLHLAGRVLEVFFTPGKLSSRGSPGPETSGRPRCASRQGSRRCSGRLGPPPPGSPPAWHPGGSILSGRWGAPPPGVAPAAARRGQVLNLQSPVSHAVSTSGLRSVAGLALALTAAPSLPGAPPGLPQVPLDLRGLRQEEDHTRESKRSPGAPEQRGVQRTGHTSALGVGFPGVGSQAPPLPATPLPPLRLRSLASEPLGPRERGSGQLDCLPGSSRCGRSLSLRTLSLRTGRWLVCAPAVALVPQAGPQARPGCAGS